MKRTLSAKLLEFHGLAQFCPQLLCLHCTRMDFRGHARECGPDNLEQCALFAHEMVGKLTGNARLVTGSLRATDRPSP